MTEPFQRQSVVETLQQVKDSQGVGDLALVVVKRILLGIHYVAAQLVLYGYSQRQARKASEGESSDDIELVGCVVDFARNYIGDQRVADCRNRSAQTGKKCPDIRVAGKTGSVERHRAVDCMGKESCKCHRQMPPQR